MRKIILGRRYDTETAQLIGLFSDSYPGQFDYVKEELYRKRTGEYFLYGEGGPQSQYAKNEGSTASGGSDIRRMTEDEAREWAEAHLSADEYEQVFPVIEDETPGIAVKLGAVIAEKRKALGLNQPEFAAKCGTTQGMISSYETGKQDMTISRLAEIAAALGMGPAELLAKVS